MLAYLDAGTTSAAIGALAAGGAGIAVVFTMYKLRFQAMFSKKKRAELEALRERQTSRADDADDSTSEPVEVDR